MKMSATIAARLTFLRTVKEIRASGDKSSVFYLGET
jgi:hypothetical protein